MITSCTSLAPMPEASTAALMAALPSCMAVRGERAPRNAPTGVRLADTMTTSEPDMVSLALSCGPRSARHDTSRPPRALAGAEPGGAAARTQAPLEYGDERLGDLRTGQALVLTIPVRNPVERAGERKRGHFRIARLDGAVLHTLADQPSDAVIDLGLQRLDVAAHRRRQVLVLGAHHAPAEFRCHRLAVMAQHGIQALARRHLEVAHIAKRRPDLLHSRHEALEQQLLLAGDVVVHRGLGDLEPRRDVIERGVVVALAIELAGGGANHRLALHRAVAQPLAARPPGGVDRYGWFARGGRAGTAAVHCLRSIIAVRPEVSVTGAAGGRAGSRVDRPSEPRPYSRVGILPAGKEARPSSIGTRVAK